MDVSEPWVLQQAQNAVGGWLAMLARPEIPEQMAAFTRSYYDALVAKGFSAEEALRILLAHGLPFQPAGR